MALLTFPVDKSDFTAPNGVTYTWDNTDGKWRVKAFRSQDDFLVEVGDTPPDEPKEGDLWWDSSPDSLTLFVYEGTAWVPAAPPVSLDGINATIEAALIVQNDLLARVASGEVKQAQIELSLEELSITKGSVSRYQIKGTSFGVASRNGELYVNSSDPELVTTMSFAPFDLNGAPIKPALTGDIVELVEAAGTLTTGEVSRFRITSGGDTQALVVEYLGGTNVFDIDEILEVYIYPQNEETASKEYVDAQDALKVNLSGENVITAPWQIRTENKTYITASSDELRLYHLADPTDRDDRWAANKGYVDTQAALKVNKTGDTYSGYLDFEAQGGGARFWRGSDKYFSIWSFQENETRCRINPGRDFKLTGYVTGDDTEKPLISWDNSTSSLHIKKVADPTSADDAATMGYVDDSIAAIPDTDLSGYLSTTGQQDLNSDEWKVRQPNSDGAFRSFINIHDGEMNLYNVVTPTGSSNEKWAANKEYADKKVAKTGGTMTGDLNLDGADRAINIENGHRFRLKAKDADGSGRTFVDIQTTDHDGPQGFDAGYRIRIYHLADPTDDYHAANRKYVDEQVASAGGGVPVGSIMIWMNSTAPDGWFKLQGGSFDINTYPQLHAYLQNTSGYSSGRLPNWGGHYPGEYGDHINQSLGSKQEYKTAKPSGGAPKTSNNIPNGGTRTFNAAGGTSAYSDAASRVPVGDGWDSVTRPPTVVVHYIIKHD